MGTVLAPAELGRAAGRARQAIGLRFGALLTAGLAFFAVAVNGYHPYAEDGGLYIAGVERLLDPALYPQQTAFVLEPERLSLFAPTVAGLTRLGHLGLPAVLLGLHLATVGATLFAAWLIAVRCWEDRAAQAGAVMLLACWLALPVAGTSLLLMDPYVTARSFSTPCMALALVGALDLTDLGTTEQLRRRGLWLLGASLAIAAAMHPLMAAQAAGATALLLCVRSRRRAVRWWGTAGIFAAAMAVAACVRGFAPPESAEYVRIALTRTYWFPAQWRWFEWIGLAAPLAILATELWRAEVGFRDALSRDGAAARRALAWMAMAAGTAALTVAVLFSRANAATHLVARLQPLRAFQIVYLVMTLALGARLGQWALRRIRWRWCVAMLLLGGTMFAAQRNVFPDSNFVELPRLAARNAWVQAFLWVREHAPKDALFALDADYINAPGEDGQCFRAIAERSALPDYSKDGGEASIAPELAAAWQAGQTAQRGLSAESDAARVAALGPTGVSWIVLQAQAATKFDCPYGNGAVKVCRLR